MPIIDVSLIEGRDPDTIRRLQDALHDAAVRTLGVPEDTVKVIIRPIPPELWCSGGETIAERRQRETIA
ncbi:4-oxalocrotonate tautomerase family protein [Rhodococcus baikonurensis]|uniref:tautomerase family protein n=1 Tax=Rhodococcus erythropolis group TaxID=2840174 RepID=UPI001C0EDD18|nr:tautomerase family protein [Rhodococcus erythropolis]PBI86853.1 4-oxalocrotonate tautomerase [Rhodococcus erythropolis]